MKTEEIINSLKICGGEGTTCQDCAYRNRLELCHRELLKGSALRLEDLFNQVKEDEKLIEDMRKKMCDISVRNYDLNKMMSKNGGLWVSVNDRLPDTELAKCLVFLYGEVCFSYFHRGEFHNPDVTHWMEIPEPPKKTYKDVFWERMKEAFPEAVLAGSVTGKCRDKLFGINKPCTYQCRDCWNQPYPEEEGGKE